MIKYVNGSADLVEIKVSVDVNKKQVIAKNKAAINWMLNNTAWNLSSLTNETIETGPPYSGGSLLSE